VEIFPLDIFVDYTIYYNERRIVGNYGIWKFFCNHDPPSKDEYTESDIKLYRAIENRYILSK